MIALQPPAVAASLGGAIAASIPVGLIAWMLYRAVEHRTDGTAIAVAAVVLAVALLARIACAALASRWVMNALGARAERLRIGVVAGLRRIPARRLREIDPGRTVALLTTGLDEAVATSTDAFDAVFGGASSALLIAFVLVAIDWRIGLVALAFLPLTVAYVWQSRGISGRAAPRLARARAEGTSRFFEYVESVGLLRAFGRTADRAARLTWALQELKLKAFETSIAPIPFGVLALFFIEFGFAIVLMAGTEVNAGAAGFAVARYLVALVVALGYFQTLFDAADGYLRLRDARRTWAEIARLIEATAVDEAHAPSLPESFDVEIDAVAFGYGRGPVLADLSCRFPARSVSVIVGRSGAGKSALAGLIAGLEVPQSGSVRIGGVDVAGLSTEQRTRLVTLVLQDTELVAGTIAGNIAAGRPGATQSDIEAAARTADCHAFITRLPRGYETPVRAGASDLSLGERQRIALARALIAGTPVFVFDECTASLDPAAERAVHAAIASLAAHATVILITHRLASIRHAPRINVLAKGRIVEGGTHAELFSLGGDYTRLWSAHEAARIWRAADGR